MDDKTLKNFIENLLKLNVTILWYNLKYDLEIIELFLISKNKIIDDIKEEKSEQLWLSI